jgi:hypothetical protein
MKAQWLTRTIKVAAKAQFMKMLLALVFGLTIAACSTAKKECEACFSHSECEGTLNCHARPMSDGSVKDVCVETSKMLTCPVAEKE